MKRVVVTGMGIVSSIGNNTQEVLASLREARSGIVRAERYAELCKIGASMGVSPALEVWGFSPNVTRLGEATLIAMDSGAPNACVLPDVYHLYKGGTDPNALKLLNKDAIAIIHVNDYPGIDRAKITDAERVYPGDGIAPLSQIFRDLERVSPRRNAFRLQIEAVSVGLRRYAIYFTTNVKHRAHFGGMSTQEHLTWSRLQKFHQFSAPC